MKEIESNIRKKVATKRERKREKHREREREAERERRSEIGERNEARKFLGGPDKKSLGKKGRELNRSHIKVSTLTFIFFEE